VCTVRAMKIYASVLLAVPLLAAACTTEPSDDSDDGVTIEQPLNGTFTTESCTAAEQTMIANAFAVMTTGSTPPRIPSASSRHT